MEQKAYMLTDREAEMLRRFTQAAHNEEPIDATGIAVEFLGRDPATFAQLHDLAERLRG